jgi:hypothetical protein
MPGDYLVGCYYFPNYHPDPRNELVHGPGWTEWELVRAAGPRFAGHDQPRVPAWGCGDESDPQVMGAKIDAAADHGIDFFIFDWYWYDDGPFLERALEEGFLGSRHPCRVRFCCMWANHDWQNIHPAKLRESRQALYPGRVTPAAFGRLTERLIGRCFTHPAHLLLDGCPYFSVYELGTLVATFGSVPATRRALDQFRQRTRAAGFAGLHLNAVVWGRPLLPGGSTPADPARLVHDLGFDSVTSYVWVHHAGLGTGQTVPYQQVRDEYFAYWERARTQFAVPYFPNVTVGWDSSPRTVQTDRWLPAAGYPFTGVITGNSPPAFREALYLTRQRLAAMPGPRLLNINSWNEWTEGSYLEPDTRHGMAYLEAVRKVFRC